MPIWRPRLWQDLRSSAAALGFGTRKPLQDLLEHQSGDEELFAALCGLGMSCLHINAGGLAEGTDNSKVAFAHRSRHRSPISGSVKLRMLTKAWGRFECCGARPWLGKRHTNSGSLNPRAISRLAHIRRVHTAFDKLMRPLAIPQGLKGFVSFRPWARNDPLLRL